MVYRILTHIILLNIIVNGASAISNETECDCLHYNECDAVRKSLQKNKGKTTIESCDEPDYPEYTGYYCCPKPIKLTISERKCKEFSLIENFCVEHGLINRGRPVDPYTIPFIASIQTRDKFNASSPWIWICGGTLIDPKFVVTAAHCVENINRTTTDITVLLGAHNISKIEQSNDNGRFNVTIKIHDDYYNTDFGDIALLELETEANIRTQKVRPACLPKTNGSEVQTFRVAGFGTTDGLRYPNALLQTTLWTFPMKNCLLQEDTKLNETLQICAGPNEKISGDVCPGDSGGPLFIEYPGRDDCLYAVMGIVSEGNYCASPGSFTLHTRISYYREWIESNVWPNEKN